MPTDTGLLTRAWAAARTVTDPELPMLTLADLGVLRGVAVDGEQVVVTLTPTYLGCPAMDTMRADLLLALHEEGVQARIRVQLDPPWSSDDITEEGRRKLAEHQIAPPGRRDGPVALGLPEVSRVESVPCPCCGAAQTVELSHFGSTACKAIRRCAQCGETFDHFKEHQVMSGSRETA